MRAIVVGAALIAIVVVPTGCGSSVSSEREPAAGSEAVRNAPGDSTSHETEPAGTTDGGPANVDDPPLSPEAVDEMLDITGEVFRKKDRRVRPDAARLVSAGIRTYESKRLLLYTDIEPEVARTLPPLVDALHDACEEYFGELPPNRERTPFQITGYLMRQPDRFEQLGLVPRNLPRFVNGRHRGYEFWMYDQEEAYYRRHLLLHEATHCYTTCVPGVRMPTWYLEGMAELFATHAVDEETGEARFRVMPDRKENFGGLGRIALVRADVAKGRRLSLDDVVRIDPFAYLKNESYAWAWAMCRYFDGHPVYSESFREIGRGVVSEAVGFEKIAGQRFVQFTFQSEFGDRINEVNVGWVNFVDELIEGYDERRNAVVFREPVALSRETEVTVEAGRGWQSTGLELRRGQSYSITATGQVTLAESPRPWLSEANGISFRYHRGRPLGRLQAAIVDDDNPESLLSVTSLGNTAKLVPARTGTLFLRLNDSPAELRDNSGRITVSIVP